MLENASALELAYTVPSACGALMAAVLLYLCVGDEIERRRTGINGLLRLDIQKSIVTASALTLALCCLTLIGVNQMSTPANPNIVLDPTTATTVVVNALLFLTVDVALIVLTGYRLLQRGATQRAAHAEADEKATLRAAVANAASAGARRDRRTGDPAAP